MQIVLTLFAASVISFSLIPLSPGSPAASILANEGRRVTAEAVRAKEHELGLDRPLLQQYLAWMGHAVRGDLGRSWKAPIPVRTLLAERIGATLLLGVVALALGLGISVAVALVSAHWRDRPADHGLRLVTLMLTGIPAFVLGLLVLQFVVLELGVGRVVSDGTLRSVWMPAGVLALTGVAGWSRPLRALLLDAGDSPFVQVAVARGASERRVLLVHALPNAFVEFLGFLALGLGGIIGGTPIVEAVFSWPGFGAMAVHAVQQRDVPVIQAFVLLSTLAYVMGSMAADLAARRLDPRRRIVGVPA